jgi:hypothetical protein
MLRPSRPRTCPAAPSAAWAGGCCPLRLVLVASRCLRIRRSSLRVPRRSLRGASPCCPHCPGGTLLHHQAPPLQPEHPAHDRIRIQRTLRVCPITGPPASVQQTPRPVCTETRARRRREASADHRSMPDAKCPEDDTNGKKPLRWEVDEEGGTRRHGGEIRSMARRSA